MELPNLEELTLIQARLHTNNAYAAHPPAHITQVSLPHIHSLRLVDSEPAIMSFFIRSLNIPVHRDLSLEVICSTGPFNFGLVTPNKQLDLELFGILANYLHAAAAARFPLEITLKSDPLLGSGIRCDVADMHVAVYGDQLPDPSVIPTFLPEAAYDATIICTGSMDVTHTLASGTLLPWTAREPAVLFTVFF